VSPDADLARIEHAVGELIRLSGSRRVHDARMRAVGLSLSRTELRFLGRLDDAGASSVSSLADALDVSQPTASRSLRTLEDDGYVTRRPHSGDGRVAIYAITAKGRKERNRLVEYMHTQLADALAGLPARRRRELAAALSELVDRLSARPE
jgi:DNA-binding MarR family transcriptional regulator